MTSEIWYQEGEDLDQLLTDLDEQHPGQVSVVSVTYPRSGGVMGFFARERVGVSYRLGDSGAADVARPAPDSPSAGDPLQALIDAAESAERSAGDPLETTEGTNAEFARMLLKMAADKSAERAAAQAAGLPLDTSGDPELIGGYSAGLSTTDFVPGFEASFEPAFDRYTGIARTDERPADAGRHRPTAARGTQDPVLNRLLEAQHAAAAQAAAEEMASSYVLTSFAADTADTPIFTASRDSMLTEVFAPPHPRPELGRPEVELPVVESPVVERAATAPAVAAPVVAAPAAPVVAAPAAPGSAAPIVPSVPLTSPVEAPHQALLDLGVPSSWLPDASVDACRAVADVIRRLPAIASPLPTGTGLLVVVGPAAVALAAAELVRTRLGAGADVLWAAGSAVAGVPAERTVPDLARAAGLRFLRPADRPTVVVLATDEPAPFAPTSEFLRALGADTVWAVADARHKPSDVRAELSPLGTVHALVLTAANRSTGPASVWELGLPVAVVDGAFATPATWAALLFDKLGVLGD